MLASIPTLRLPHLAASIKEFGFVNPIIIDKEHGVIAGHGRLAAAQKLGLKEVPCLRVEHLTENQKRAYILADNRLAELAEWDDELLKIEFEELKIENFDLNLSGFDSDFLKDFEENGTTKPPEEPHESMYTRKVEIPTYEPTSEVKPELSEILELTKFNKLITEINSRKDLSKQDQELLKLAAHRHIVFNYQNIAEYYAHSNKDVQDLMEKSALVIIDFNKAIENGFVQLTDQIAKQFSADYPEGSEEVEVEIDEE